MIAIMENGQQAMVQLRCQKFCTAIWNRRTCSNERLSCVRVLITNDDGVDAEGLYLLEELALQFTDDVCVVAPLSNQSGVGRAISLHKDIEFVRRG